MNQDEYEYVRQQVEEAKINPGLGVSVVKCPINPGCIEEVCRYDGDGTRDRYSIQCPQCGLFEMWKNSGSYSHYQIMPIYPWNFGFTRNKEGKWGNWG